MKIKVLFFGATAAAVGKRYAEFETQKDEAVGELLTELCDKYPRLSNHKLFVAINEEYAEPDANLSPGDEVAIFTAVSGG
ncbi:MAG TPA: MoaD/ThiS family protein [Pyrinomonadaceae bacterium]|nr:MoaD/ThiS family protein [Pyrinomonadaceae bacterium]